MASETETWWIRDWDLSPSIDTAKIPYIKALEGYIDVVKGKKEGKNEKIERGIRRGNIL